MSEKMDYLAEARTIVMAIHPTMETHEFSAHLILALLDKVRQAQAEQSFEEAARMVCYFCRNPKFWSKEENGQHTHIAGHQNEIICDAQVIWKHIAALGRK